MASIAAKAAPPTNIDSLASLTDTIAWFTKFHMADHNSIITIPQ